MISNSINYNVPYELYDLDIKQAAKFAVVIDNAKSDLEFRSEYVEYPVYKRRPQTIQLLRKLETALVPCSYDEWLHKRGIITSQAYSIDYSKVTMLDMLDLYVIPDDHIIINHGFKTIDGPVFTDRRNGQLAGICVRNTTSNIGFASDEKYTTSNFGWFLYGYDDYEYDDEIYIVEGVFDRLKMIENGYNAIALANASPTALQIACLTKKYNNLKSCLDNDIYGMIGSRILHRVLGIPLYTTKLKDPGCYHNEPIELVELDIGYIENFIRTNKHTLLDVIERHLPYN